MKDAQPPLQAIWLPGWHFQGFWQINRAFGLRGLAIPAQRLTRAVSVNRDISPTQERLPTAASGPDILI
jgi:hypothetical protein